MLDRRRFGISLTVGALVTLLLSGSSSVAIATTSRASAAVAEPGTTSADIRFRADFGLANRPDQVAAARAEYAVSRVWGVALSPSEETLMNRRAAASAELGGVHAFGAANPSTWGGIWITYPAGASSRHLMTVNVGTTASVSDTDRALQGLLPHDVDLRVVRVKHSLAELDALHPDLASSEVFAAHGASFYSAATLVDGNDVEVTVDHASPGLRAALTRTYGDAVRVVEGGPVQEDSCSRTNCGPPWRGGIKIYRPGPAYCTLGFNVASYGGVWSYALFTAGHCGNGTWRQGSSTGAVIGTTTQNHFGDATRIDVQVIVASAPNTHTNQYLDGTSGCANCALRSVTAAQGHDADAPGDAICNHGYWSGTQCGKIVSTNFTYHGDPKGGNNPVTIFHTREATYARHGGDSGGPVTAAASMAVGSHTDFNSANGDAVYTHIWDMENVTGWDVYFGG